MNAGPISRAGIRNSIVPNTRQYIRNAIIKAMGDKPMATKTASLENLSPVPAPAAAPKSVQSPTAVDAGIQVPAAQSAQVAGNRPSPMTKIGGLSDFFKNTEMSKNVNNYLKNITRKPAEVLKGPAGPKQFVMIRGQKIPIKTHSNTVGTLGPKGEGQFVMKTAGLGGLKTLLKAFKAGKKVGAIGKKHSHIGEAMAGGATAGAVSAATALAINNIMNKKRNQK